MICFDFLGRLIVVSNPKLVKEMFSSDPAFAGKPYFENFDMYEDHPKLGIIGSDGELWETHRRFLLRQLRDFGFGKSSMESRILDEVNEVILRYKSLEGQSVGNIKNTLRLALVNSLWTILASQRFDHDDPTLLKLAMNTTDTFNEVAEGGSLLAFMPWLRHIAPEFSGYNKVRRVFEENRKFFQESIDQHKKNFDEDDLKDFVDVYLAEMRKTKDPKSFFYGEAAERQLVAILFDLFLAGSDTTAVTLAWAILYMCKWPEAQKKLQEEIDHVTAGNSRKVSVQDRPNMPYTLALIDEVLRLSSIAQDGVQHNAMADREFHGYFIPKDAMLEANLYFIHHDPRIWGDPETFRPERFLSEDGKKYVRNENLQAFQIGRRACVGESLARDSVFLCLTNLFQQFSMEFDKEKEAPSLESILGFLRSPRPFWVVMKDRLESVAK